VPADIHQRPARVAGVNPNSEVERYS
jgi:hypothetical protein